MQTALFKFYDALNRIISEKDIDKEQEICYTYDNDGNILTKSVNGVATSYAYGEGTDRSGYVRRKEFDFGKARDEEVLLMGKYKLTEEEKAAVNKFCKYSVPFIFKSGEYCGYMQYFELVNFEICPALLKGKRIDEKIYQAIALREVDIIKEKLDNYALEFLNLYLFIKHLAKKYH